jgi:hypothetical protein
VRVDIQVAERLGFAHGQGLDAVECIDEVRVDRTSRLESQRLSQVPEHLVQLPHDREDREHLLGGRRVRPPVASEERDLGDLLAGAEAVVDDAAGEAFRPEARVDRTAQVALEVRTGHVGRLVDREVRRRREGRHDAAQREAVRAVRSQAEVGATPLHG